MPFRWPSLLTRPCPSLLLSRSDPKIASAYYYEVKDATGSTVLTSRQANINDVTRDSLDFTTDAIAGANQRYTVVVKACTGRGTKCSAGIESNPEGVGELGLSSIRAHVGFGCRAAVLRSRKAVCASCLCTQRVASSAC